MLGSHERWSQSVVAASCPGGLAVHYRVQIPVSGSRAAWRLVASFREAAGARLCADQLRAAGQIARIVAWRYLPTAH